MSTMNPVGAAMTSSMTAKNRHALSAMRQFPLPAQTHNGTTNVHPRVNSAQVNQGFIDAR